MESGKSGVKTFHAVRDYVTITFGLIIYLLAYFGFIYSHEITSGGLAGIASVISWAFDVPFSLPYNLINLTLLGIALRVLGWRFSVKTIYSVILLGIGTTLIERYILPLMRDSLPLQDQPAMAMVLGSILIGLSLAMVFSANGSTGGTDIVAAIVNKYKPISIGRSLMYIDAVTVTASWFVFEDPDKLVFSMVQILVTNFSLDYFLDGTKQSVQFLIMTRYPEEMAKKILNDVKRGVTFIKGQGAYSGQDIQILMVVARKSMANDVLRAIKEVDPKAFTTKTNTNNVYGEGFDAIKVSEKRSKVKKV